MAVTESEAIEIARTTAAARKMPWYEGYISTYREQRAGRDCWVVAVSTPPPPGKPAWFWSFDDGFFYIVDAEKGRCIGVEGLPHFSMSFPDEG